MIVKNTRLPYRHNLALHRAIVDTTKGFRCPDEQDVAAKQRPLFTGRGQQPGSMRPRIFPRLSRCAELDRVLFAPEVSAYRACHGLSLSGRMIQIFLVPTSERSLHLCGGEDVLAACSRSRQLASQGYAQNDETLCIAHEHDRTGYVNNLNRSFLNC